MAIKNFIGFDVGTYNLITCSGDEKSSSFNTQVNAYLHMKNPEPSTKKTLMALNKPILPFGKDGKDILILGRDAIELACDFGAEFHRPMSRGCVGSDESSYPILASMLHGMLNKITISTPTVLYYSKPANAVSEDTNVDLHGALLQGIFENYPPKTPTEIKVFPMNEASAIIYSECSDRTGLAISTGAGMVNISYVKWGATIFSFSIAQSGDWIDQTVSKACNLSKAEVNLKKETVDISKEPSNQFELILKAQYNLLIRSSIEKMIMGIEEDRGASTINKEIPIVIAGGVSSIAGFMDAFKNIFSKYKFPLKISEIKRAGQGVKAISHGLYEAAKLYE